MYKYDQRTSFGTAYIFFQVAKQCLKQEKLSEHIIFVSATNYGLAVELFLKTILNQLYKNNSKKYKTRI